MKTAKIENWKDGDVFALKINNKSSKYNGMYLILIKSFPLHKYMNYKNFFSFRAKLWLSKELPTLSEIKKLEFIKTAYIHYEERFLPMNGNETYNECVKRKKNLKFYPDEYNFLYAYYFTLQKFKNDDFDDFIYIGNEKLPFIKEEFVSDSEIGIDPILYKNELMSELPRLYENFNLKKGNIYNPEQHAIIEKNVKLFMKVIKAIPKF